MTVLQEDFLQTIVNVGWSSAMQAFIRISCNMENTSTEGPSISVTAPYPIGYLVQGPSALPGLILGGSSSLHVPPVDDPTDPILQKTLAQCHAIRMPPTFDGTLPSEGGGFGHYKSHGSAYINLSKVGIPHKSTKFTAIMSIPFIHLVGFSPDTYSGKCELTVLPPNAGGGVATEGTAGFSHSATFTFDLDITATTVVGHRSGS